MRQACARGAARRVVRIVPPYYAAIILLATLPDFHARCAALEHGEIMVFHAGRRYYDRLLRAGVPNRSETPDGAPTHKD